MVLDEIPLVAQLHCGRQCSVLRTLKNKGELCDTLFERSLTLYSSGGKNLRLFWFLATGWAETIKMSVSYSFLLFVDDVFTVHS